MRKKVVITGAGIISPVGTGMEAYWKALSEGATGFRKITLFDTSEFRVHTGGEIRDFDAETFLGKRGLRTLDRSTRLVCSAARLALDDAGIEITEDNAFETGVAIGSTFGSLDSIARFDREGLTEGPRYVNPSLFPNTVINSPASNISIRFGIKGFNTTISTGFCASLDAIIYAADFLRLGRAEAVLAGGTEEMCEDTFRCFHGNGMLSGLDGTPPACCPYDAHRNGFILSEGAAVLVLSTSEYALRHGMPILASVAGYGQGFDHAAERNYGNGHGIRKAIETALESAGREPDTVDLVMGCANSTKGLDLAEARAIKDIFGSHQQVTTIKSMLGETFSAGGALSVSAAACSIQHDVITPTVNCNEKDPACELDNIVTETRSTKVETALVLCADPRGNCSAMLLEKYHDG